MAEPWPTPPRMEASLLHSDVQDLSGTGDVGVTWLQWSAQTGEPALFQFR